MYFLDGRPLIGAVAPELDAMYQAGQIMGIEIYRGESVPQEFRTNRPPQASGTAVQSGGEGMACPTVVLWSAADLGLHVGS